MTVWQFAWLQMGFAVVIMTLSLITVIGRIWTTRTGRRSYTGRWYEDRWLSPGIYRFYGDGSYGINKIHRVVRYTICVFGLYVTWGTIGAILGMFLLKDVQRADLYQTFADTRMATQDYMIYGLFIAFVLIHFISIPASRFLKVVRLALPFFAIIGMLLAMLGSVWFDRWLLRYATGPCRIFNETNICALLT